MRAQIEFVETLGSYAELVRLANEACGEPQPLPEMCAQVEEILSPAQAEAQTLTVHCVGHGHIDMNWMWSWPETVATTYDTFASMLSIMREYPEFTYSQSQASVYELIQRYHPRMFAEIVERVKEGRWEVTAAQWVEGDKNLAQGETLARSYLYTRKFFHDHFGLEPEDVPVQWEPDTFGHANTIPMIAKLGGVKYYYACRTGGGFDHPGKDRPPMFWWQGPDGSRILVNRETSWYNSYVNIGDNIALPAAEFFKATGLKHWLNVYGIGNHGGGPTRREIDYYLDMRDWPVYPKVIFSTSKAFFEACEAQGLGHLPVLDHELNFEFTGCYTSQSLIKEANRLGENQCLDAEAMLAMAQLGGLPRPDVADQLEQAWRNVLFNQFHDILPGSGVRATREHARGLFQETAAITSAIKREVMSEVCDRIDLGISSKGTEFEGGAGLGAGISGVSMPSGGGSLERPMVAFNTLCWPRTDAVYVTLWDTGFDPHSIVVVDPDGVAHPTFFVEKSEEWGHEKIALWFYARDVPGLGYKLFRFREGTPNDDGPRVTIRPQNRISGPFGDVSFDRYRSGVSLCGADRDPHETRHPKPETRNWSLGVARSSIETPRYMTSWVLGGAEKIEDLVAHRFDLLGEQRNVATLQPSGQNIMAGGSHQMKVFGSSLTMRTRVHSALPRIDFEIDLDWREIGDEQRGIPGLLIGFGGGSPLLRQTPFGSVRANALTDDEPTLGYVLMDSGLAVLTETKSGFRATQDGIFFRAIRSSFDPDHAPEVCRQTFRFAVAFGASLPSDLNRLAKEFQHPLIVCPAVPGTGEWPSSRGFLEGSYEAVRSDPLTAIVVEHNGVSGPAVNGKRVDWMGRPATGAAELAPHEIVNLKL